MRGKGRLGGAGATARDGGGGLSRTSWRLAVDQAVVLREWGVELVVSRVVTFLDESEFVTAAGGGMLPRLFGGGVLLGLGAVGDLVGAGKG